jgi:ferritin-like protein
LTGSSTTLHEPAEALEKDTIDRHRAIVSLMEELEAVDWYDQRIDAATDDELRAILVHNRDEEKEHAAMVLEWLRRRDAALDAHLREYLFTSKNLAAVEELEAEHDAGLSTGDGSLEIGSLKERVADE